MTSLLRQVKRTEDLTTKSPKFSLLIIESSKWNLCWKKSSHFNLTTLQSCPSDLAKHQVSLHHLLVWNSSLNDERLWSYIQNDAYASMRDWTLPYSPECMSIEIYFTHVLIPCYFWHITWMSFHPAGSQNKWCSLTWQSLDNFLVLSYIFPCSLILWIKVCLYWGMHHVCSVHVQRA